MNEEVPPLTHIYFYLTEGCNLRCRHCWIAPTYDKAGTCASLPVTLFEAAILEAKPLGLHNVKLTGGEPLLHPHFNELLEIVRREELFLTVETNGVLCSHEVAAEIAKSPKRFVSVSIDGADAITHEWLRGVPGCFEKAKQAVTNLVAVGIRPQVIMSVMRRNAHQIEAVVKMAEELGAASVKFNLIQPTARGEHMLEQGETLSVAELIKLGNYVEREVAPSNSIKLIFDRPYAFRPLSCIHSGAECGRCAIFTIIGVIASGQYALCGIGYQVPELVFGVVGKDKLEQVWRENSVLNALREGMPRKLEGICAQCLMKQVCLGSCIAQNYYDSGSLWAPYWFCAEAEKAGLFPDSRLI